jgi:hypothetical protein
MIASGTSPANVISNFTISTTAGTVPSHAAVQRDRLGVVVHLDHERLVAVRRQEPFVRGGSGGSLLAA